MSFYYCSYYFHFYNKVDKGAIRFILSGANIMCPGLTSKGAKMETPLPSDTVVVSSLVYISNSHIQYLDSCNYRL